MENEKKIIQPMSAEGIKQLRDILTYRNDVRGPGLAYFSPERALALIAAYDAEKSRADKNADDLRRASALAINANVRAEKAEAENTRLNSELEDLKSQCMAEERRANFLSGERRAAIQDAANVSYDLLQAKERAEQAEAEVGKLRSLVIALENLQQSTTNAICDANVTESCRQGILNAPKRIGDMVAYNSARFGGSWPALSIDSPTPCPICGGSGHIGDCEED